MFIYSFVHEFGQAPRTRVLVGDPPPRFPVGKAKPSKKLSGMIAVKEIAMRVDRSSEVYPDGRQDAVKIFGSDYPTDDGTCTRDMCTSVTLPMHM